MTTILNLEPITTLTRSQFFQLCQANPDVQIERSPQGKLIIVTAKMKDISRWKFL